MLISDDLAADLSREGAQYLCEHVEGALQRFHVEQHQLGQSDRWVKVSTAYA